MRNYLAIVCLLCFSITAIAQQPEPAPPLPAASIERLQSLTTTLDNKKQQLAELEQQLKASSQASEQAEFEEQINTLKQDIKELNQSFEQVALGGADMSVFEGQTEDESLDWRKELAEAMRPLVDSLKELTEKPRRIDGLRNDIKLYQDQLEVTAKAQAALTTLVGQELPQDLQPLIEAKVEEWQEREENIRQDLELAEFQLANLLGENTNWWDTAAKAVSDFFQGRGLTLLLAVTVLVLVWLFMRGLFWLYTHKLTKPSQRSQSTRYRLIVFSFRALSVLMMIISVLIVFYVVGDLLLLVLMILLLIGIGLGFKNYLPRYLAEAKLLLNIGPVREGERLVYQGIPWQVRSLNVYAILRNPDLEGVLRLPLAQLMDMHSRPSGNEPWFPCQKEDYLLLPDGSFGQVIRQTTELVLFKTMGGMQVQYATADFLQLNFRNITRKGFGVAMTFGIDYQHQKIALDKVPDTFEQALQQALANSEFSAHVKSLLVDFKEAAASSLDYLIFVGLESAAAAHYYTVPRVLQKTCVEVCNREGWGIPFSQITVHQGEGFTALNHQTSNK